jgi:hypothetical protein
MKLLRVKRLRGAGPCEFGVVGKSGNVYYSSTQYACYKALRGDMVHCNPYVWEKEEKEYVPAIAEAGG